MKVLFSITGSLSLSIYLYTYTHMYIYIYTHTCISIYIYVYCSFYICMGCLQGSSVCRGRRARTTRGLAPRSRPGSAGTLQALMRGNQRAGRFVTSSSFPPTSAYVSICQHTSAYVSIRQHTRDSGVRENFIIPTSTVAIRQHTSAYASIRQHTPAYASIRQHTPAYASKGS